MSFFQAQNKADYTLRCNRRRRRDGTEIEGPEDGKIVAAGEPALQRGRAMHGIPVLFVDVDPSYLWIRQVTREMTDLLACFFNTRDAFMGFQISMLQYDTMWLEQLWMDGIWGQIQALRNMARPRGPSRGSLLKLDGMFDCLVGKDVLDDFLHHFYVRCEAAYALANWQVANAPTTAEADVAGSWSGVELLLRACRHMFFSPATHLPEPNYFNDDDNYAIRKACIVAFSRIRYGAVLQLEGVAISGAL